MANHTQLRNPIEELDDLKKNVDDMFLVVNGIIVSLMQAGFCCLEVGAVRTKNATNIVMKNILDMVICALVYFLIGYALGYGDGSSIVGLSYWAGVGLPSSMMAHWFFQFIFAATAATIISGAVAERCNFLAYIIYNAAISGFVYPVVSHWIWYEGGWLLRMGYRDFAGSGAVHALAGVASFIAAKLLGPRTGRFVNGQAVDIPGHSIPLVGLGGLLLMSGFLAFNGGSLGHVTEPGDGEVVATCVVNTVMGGSGAALLFVGLSHAAPGIFSPSKWHFTLTLNSVLTGMVAVCAGADVYSFFGAFMTGVIGALVYISFHYLMLFFQVDDPLDAVAVHLGGGAWGVLAAPIIGRGGIVYEGTKNSFANLGYNAVGLLVIMIWSGVTSYIIFGGLKYANILRVSEEEEIIGLDEAKHGEVAYPFNAWNWTLFSVQSDGHEKNHGVYKIRNTEHDNNAFEMDTTDHRTK